MKISRKKFGNLSLEIPLNTNQKCMTNTKILSKTTQNLVFDEIFKLKYAQFETYTYIFRHLQIEN